MIQRILLAESDRHIREDYFEYLYRYAIKIELAYDGLECISKLRSNLPDLVVLDLDLPWGGGDGVLEIMREESRFLQVPVILTCLHSLPERLLWAPVVKVVSKPCTPISLLAGTIFSNHVSKSGQPLLEERFVLVVDDEPSIRKLLQRHLEQHGCRVWTAGTGEDAIRLVEDFSDQISVVLLDVQMKDLDGPHTLDFLLDCKPDLPVCFMTGDSGEYDFSDLIRRGARHVFQKPFNLKKISQIVHSYLEQSNVPISMEKI